MRDISLLWLILSLLAAWRMAILFTVDIGPWEIFERLRRAIRLRYGEHSWQVKGTVCIYCQSVWWGTAAALALWFFPGSLWVQIPILALGISGAICVLHTKTFA